MSDATSRLEADRQSLLAAQQRGPLATLRAFARLSGPGWLQSAITLGGGSLASSLIMGVLAGTTLLWVQPLAMLLGIVMLSAIAYVTTSTGQRPFAAINRHVSPVLGWGWLLAALAANVFWCLPQYALAAGVLQQNLLPDLLGSGGVLGDTIGKLVIAGSILLLTTAITWAYDSGNWGIRLYEWVLKAMVAGIVLSFFGVLFAIRQELDWGALLRGFIPTWSSINSPSPQFAAVLSNTQHESFWTEHLVSRQHDVMISAAATAVGINMTFLFPYSILARGWTRTFRGLAVFDLSTGMLIPYVLATSCVVIAAANQLHTRPVAGFAREVDGQGRAIVPSERAKDNYYLALEGLLAAVEGPGEVDQLKTSGTAELRARLDELPESDRRVAAMLVSRDAFDLATSLEPLAGRRVANLVFGLGVLGMALSTISLLMLISGFCVCEALGIDSKGWPHRLGTLAASTGVLGPFIWSEASFYLAVYVSAFGLMLLPIAYWSFFFLMNQRSLMGDELPRGGQRVCWNILMLVAAGIATAASIYSIHKQLAWGGLLVMAVFVIVALVVRIAGRSAVPANK